MTPRHLRARKEWSAQEQPAKYRVGLWISVFMLMAPPSLADEPGPPESGSELPLTKSILDLQPDKISLGVTSPGAQLELINLNPDINRWFILRLTKGGAVDMFHIESADTGQNLKPFADNKGYGILIASGSGAQPLSCSWPAAATTINSDRKANKSFTGLCDGRLFVRNPIRGRQTAKEFVASFLRDNVWGGEAIMTLIKKTAYKDRFKLSSAIQMEAKPPPLAKGPLNKEDLPKAMGPHPARLAEAYQASTLNPEDLGIPVDGAPATSLAAGRWFAAMDNPGIYVSVVLPKMVHADLLKTYQKRVFKLDDIEKEALVLMVALDLDVFDLGFAIGTEHPRVSWSERALDEVIDDRKPGPDGIGEIIPIVGSGKVPPYLTTRVAMTFAGGFKRSHGAFKWGSLAKRNDGSHYGFIEHGVVFSKLQSGLSTMTIDAAGHVELLTWRESADAADQKSLTSFLHARQNGVPIIDGRDSSGIPIPGKLVSRWGQGNWSGSVDSKQRALRAAICDQRSERGRYLIYGYFSTATPNAMARVFQAYRCSYAMHLDMNALEHTYLAIYRQNRQGVYVDHLVKGMDVLDSYHQGKVLPRFIGRADNRDFFYAWRRDRR